MDRAVIPDSKTRRRRHVSVMEKLGQLKREVETGAHLVRSQSPEAISRRTTLRSMTAALARADSPYARRFIRALAALANRSGVDMFTTFAKAVANAPGSASIEATPVDLIVEPGRLTSDMRIALCRAFGCGPDDDIIFAGFYPPPGAAIARLVYRIGIEVPRPDSMRFIPWLASELDLHGISVSRGELVAWAKGEESPEAAPMNVLKLILHQGSGEGSDISSRP